MEGNSARISRRPRFAAAKAGPHRVPAGGLRRNRKRGREEADHGPRGQEILRRPSRRVSDASRGRPVDATFFGRLPARRSRSPRASKGPAGTKARRRTQRAERSASQKPGPSAGRQSRSKARILSRKKRAKRDGKSGAFNDRRPPRPGQPEGELLALADWGGEPIQLAAAGEVNEPGPPPLPRPPAAKSTKPPWKNKPAGKQRVATQPAGKKNSASVPAAAAPERPEPEFRPLDEILQREIRDQILRSRTQAAMKEKMEAAYDFLTSLHEQLIPAEIGAAPKMSAGGTGKESFRIRGPASAQIRPHAAACRSRSCTSRRRSIRSPRPPSRSRINFSSVHRST